MQIQSFLGASFSNPFALQDPSLYLVHRDIFLPPAQRQHTDRSSRVLAARRRTRRQVDGGAAQHTASLCAVEGQELLVVVANEAVEYGEVAGPQVLRGRVRD